MTDDLATQRTESSHVIDMKVKFKFGTDILISKELLDRWEMPYEETQLEDSFLGPSLRIKRG